MQLRAAKEPLRLEELPVPAPTRGQVLIRVHRAGVNFADLSSTLGRYAMAPPPPFIPGLEVAGHDVANVSVQLGANDERMLRVRRMVSSLQVSLAAMIPAEILLPQVAADGSRFTGHARVTLAEDPLACVALGTGQMLTDFNLLRKISIE